MGYNSELIFEAPQPVIQVFGQIEQGENLFRIQVTGPESLVTHYMETAPLQLRLINAEEAAAMLEEMAGPQGSSYPNEPDERKSPPLAQPVEALDIGIYVVNSDGAQGTLYLEEDPTVAWGGERRYYISGAGRAWASCQTSFGDADLYLDEYHPGVGWELRQASVNAGASSDTVDRNQVYTGNWRLRVYGYRDSTYTLMGIFPQAIF